MNQWRNRC